MSIDRKDQGTSTPEEREWSVSVSISVFEVIPRDILAGWMAVETFARSVDSCWPSNRALAARLNMRSIPAVQDLLLKLEDHGLIERRDRGGNRRDIVLLRRTGDPIAVSEWAAMVAKADQLRAERSEAAALKRMGQAPFREGTPLFKGLDEAPSGTCAQAPSVEGGMRSRLRGKNSQQPTRGHAVGSGTPST